jgi:hypothetical protein
VVGSIQAAVALQFQVAVGTHTRALPTEPEALQAQPARQAQLAPQRAGQTSLANAVSFAFISAGSQSGASPLAPAAGKDSAGNRRNPGADSEKSRELKEQDQEYPASEAAPPAARHRALGAYAAQSGTAALRQAAGLDMLA